MLKQNLRRTAHEGKLLRSPSAIDSYTLARDQPGGGGGQECDHVSYFLYCAEPAHRNPTNDRFEERRISFEERLGEWCIQECRRYRIYPDAGRGELNGERFSKPFERMFARAIHAALRCANASHLRGQVDDGDCPRAEVFPRVFLHPANRLTRKDDRGSDVESEDGINVIIGGIDQQSGAVGTGIVDDKVQTGQG